MSNKLDTQRESLINCLKTAKIIKLIVPIDNGKEFPNHDFIEVNADDFVYSSKTGILELWQNPGYEI